MRRLAAVAAYVVLLVASAWLLERLAQWQFTAHLRDQAARALALTATGDTPYRWQFHDFDDLVAGRVFGAVDARFSDGQLVVRSSGASFEIGLPLARAVDLQRFPHLRVAYVADASTGVQAVVREQLDAPEIASASTTLEPGASSFAIDLSAPGWTTGARPAQPPRDAAMLRLRVTLPAGKALRLSTAALDRADNAQRIDLSQTPHIVDTGAASTGGTPAYRLSLHSKEVDIAAFANSINTRMPLLTLLPQQGRVEQQVAARNVVLAAAPGAILIPEDALAETFAQARAEVAVPPEAAATSWRWLWLGAYALIVAYFRWRPPHAPRARAFTEIVLVLAGPLWLIVGGQFNGNPDATQKLLIALTLVYAVSLSLPKRWRWNGSARAWLLAGALVALAALLGFILHRTDAPLRAIGFGHIARYLAWALLQQYLICAVCTERWRIVTGNSASAVYLGALGFALMHTPNATLMLATLFAGLCWCALYLRERALLPLAVSHAASALVLLALLPTEILASAEVSTRFFF